MLARLPKSAHPNEKKALAEINNAEDKDHAIAAAKAFGAKWPKAAAKITDDLDVLLEFFDYTAEHWVHLRTTNPIESTFATVRLRQGVTKGPCSRAAGIAVAFRLIEAAQARHGQPTWSPSYVPASLQERKTGRTTRPIRRRTEHRLTLINRI